VGWLWRMVRPLLALEWEALLLEWLEALTRQVLQLRPLQDRAQWERRKKGRAGLGHVGCTPRLGTDLWRGRPAQVAFFHDRNHTPDKIGQQ
jgi:hypothetical protein